MKPAIMEKYVGKFEGITLMTLRYTTYTNYARFLETFMDWAGWDRTPESFDGFTVEDFKVQRLKEGATPGRVYAELAAVRRFFQWLVEEGVLQKNPCKGRVTMPAQDPRLAKKLRPVDQQTLRKQARMPPGI